MEGELSGTRGAILVMTTLQRLPSVPTSRYSDCAFQYEFSYILQTRYEKSEGSNETELGLLIPTSDRNRLYKVDDLGEAGALTGSIADEVRILIYSNSAAMTNSCASAYHSILSTLGLQQTWQSSI